MIAWWQILILTAYAAYEILDELTIYSSLSQPVAAGLIAGLVMGDMKAGLVIGASLQLMILGVGTFGGASRIDATTGTVLATAFSVGLKMDPKLAISTIAVPVAAVMVQLDVLARFANTYFAHRVDKMIDEFNYKGINRNFLYGALPWALSRCLPIFLALAFGGGVVQRIVKVLTGPLAWLGSGLTFAGAALPAVGFAILLRYLPVKKHIAYLILGFTITTLFTVLFGNIQALGTGLVAVNKTFATKFNAMPMLAIAFIGLALAILHYKGVISKPKAAAVTTNNTTASQSNEGEITDDEL